MAISLLLIVKGRSLLTLKEGQKYVTKCLISTAAFVILDIVRKVRVIFSECRPCQFLSRFRLEIPLISLRALVLLFGWILLAWREKIAK